MKIINKQPIAFLENLEKAFYKDNYQNRKLGRVGRPYGSSSNKEKEQNEIEIFINKTEILKNAEGKRLDAIIKYSNSAKEEGVEGIKVAKDATDNEKRIAIAKFYKEAAEGDAENLDEIIEEALADYVPEEEKTSFKNISDLPFGKKEITRGGWMKECTINGHSFIKRDKSSRFYGEYEVDDEIVSKSEFLSLANKYNKENKK